MIDSNPFRSEHDRQEAERQLHCVRSDHVCAAIEMLERVIARLEAGTAPEDIGGEVVLIGRMMERKT